MTDRCKNLLLQAVSDEAGHRIGRLVTGGECYADMLVNILDRARGMAGVLGAAADANSSSLLPADVTELAFGIRAQIEIALEIVADLAARSRGGRQDD